MPKRELKILGIPRSWLNIPFGVPQLDATGLLDPGVLPPLAISQVFVESSEAAMLALTAQIGDVCKRTDLQPNQSFMLKLEPATVLANWIQISDIAINFTTLLDTPNNYAAAADKWVKVNATPDGLEFITHDKALHDALNIDADTLDGADTGLNDADVPILPATSDGDFLQRGVTAWAAQAHDKTLHDALLINAAQVDGKEANDFLWRDGSLTMLGDLNMGAFGIELTDDKKIYFDTAKTKTLFYDSGNGRFEFTNDIYIGGDIILTGLLDGVNLAAFKTAYDAHDHSAGDPTQVDYTDLLNIPSTFTPSAHKDTHKSGGGDAFTMFDIVDAIVKRLQTTTGPTTLTMGALADGEFMKRSGSTIIGATPGNIVSPIISPASISNPTHNWNPTGLSTAQAIRATASNNTDLTGIVAQEDGRRIYLMNIGANNIKLKNENASSTAANRFALKGDLTLEVNESAILIYDGTSARWRVAGINI